MVDGTIQIQAILFFRNLFCQKLSKLNSEDFTRCIFSYNKSQFLTCSYKPYKQMRNLHLGWNLQKRHKVWLQLKLKHQHCRLPIIPAVLSWLNENLCSNFLLQFVGIFTSQVKSRWKVSSLEIYQCNARIRSGLEQA